MCLTIGSSGADVLYLQYGLHILCCFPGRIDGCFGEKTRAAVMSFQKKYNLVADGIAGPKTWDKMCSLIAPIQAALNAAGFGAGNVDGVAGPITYHAILAFQMDRGLTADGMAGDATHTALGFADKDSGGTSSVLSLGSDGTLTKYFQRILSVLGYTKVQPTGIFDSVTKGAVETFQTAHDLTVDGIVGPRTWDAVFAAYRVPAAGTGIEKLVNVAKHELAWGFQENNGNNITPYGQWYGMNGQPWCAMFVSWCAKHADILDGESHAVPIVPRFAYCPAGVEWYKSRGSFFYSSSDYEAQAGDTIFFWSTINQAADHTGIVSGAAASTITVIEGNSSDGVRQKTYARSSSYICGFGRNNGI